MALIASMSVGVIALVVWLVVVFLSVTEGIERSWLEKLTALNAPLKITPTRAYFSSYYYLVDTISERSGYSYKSIGEKSVAPLTDPHDPEIDATPPSHWPEPSGVDPVKAAFAILQQEKGVVAQDFEISAAMLRLNLQKTQTFLTQVSYIASFADQSPYVHSLVLEGSELGGDGIFLAKSFQDHGVKVGDTGYLAYQAATPSSVQEQRIFVKVAGFYDAGVMSVGNKIVLAPSSIVHTISTASQLEHFDKTQSSGIQVWFPQAQEAGKVKARLQAAFEKAGISPYWKIATYHEYDFAKDLLQQFQSDKYLFTLIGVIILIVACCNIISLLMILVNDKKKEIGILQAMGTSSRSIALIFGGCGVAIGFASSLIGVVAAILTLHNLDSLVHALSFLQGHDAFNAAFYGKSLPNTLSHNALLFVFIATPVISLLAGVAPALKASRLRPSEILRSE